MVLNNFKSGIFSLQPAEGTGYPVMSARITKVSDRSSLKILTRKQMLQRLPIALAQVKAGNTSENLLNKICQIIYFLYRAKEITKKIYNNIINSIKV